LLVVLAACSATQLKETWKDPAFAGPAPKQLMVIGVSRNDASRRTFEDEFAKALSAVGVRASPSYPQLPGTAAIPQERIVATARQSGAEGVLVMRVLKRDVALTPSYGSPQFASQGFGSYYRGAHVEMTDVVDAYDVLTIEAILWNLASDKPVWSGTAQVSDPRNVAASTAELAKTLIARMKADGVI
jgi:hypothetical protein